MVHQLMTSGSSAHELLLQRRWFSCCRLGSCPSTPTPPTPPIQHPPQPPPSARTCKRAVSSGRERVGEGGTGRENLSGHTRARVHILTTLPGLTSGALPSHPRPSLAAARALPARPGRPPRPRQVLGPRITPFPTPSTRRTRQVPTRTCKARRALKRVSKLESPWGGVKV